MTFENLRREISAAYLAGEDAITAKLLERARLTTAESTATQSLARELVNRIRARPAGSGIDALLQEYALSTEEGVVLMCLSESLLRVPDTETADRLIRDMLGHGRWDYHLGKSHSLFVNASTFALMLTGRVVRLDETSRWDFEGIWRKLVGRAGEPVIRQAVTYAMRILGRQFVLGRTIEEALGNTDKTHRYSFDMLGEAAYTKHDAARYLASYRNALRAIAKKSGARATESFGRPSISVKLSALHPRYEYSKHERVMTELLPRLIALAGEAKAANLGFTVDAEEAERLDLMLDVFEALSAAPGLQGWNGLGLAVQAYQKRALPVLAWVVELARAHSRRIPVRLVKGAYWDTEIKRGQEAGIADYPVFTRKAGTDVSYIACARAMFAAGDAIYPQFATHNAHTLAVVETLAANRTDFEFQRLHGMGEALYDVFHDLKQPAARGIATRVYAPVGSHEDLLAYLVRRLLENGANTSFVNRLADEEAPIDDIVADPVATLSSLAPRRNPRIALPRDMLPDRKNSQGFFWSDPAIAGPVLEEMKRSLASPQLAIANGASGAKSVFDPSDRRRKVGEVVEAAPRHAKAALESAYRTAREWDALGGDARATILERAADLYERNRAHLMALAVREAGKTLPTALGEVREAADFLRYYAKRARAEFQNAEQLPGPTGEDNKLSLHGRGVFACIAPWNFPLAIFTGQVAGALAAGNAVLAKPAERTPLIAAAGVKLLHEAGVPEDVLHFLPGDGPAIGNALFPDARLAGVAFTGSTQAANAINRALAARDGPIAALIAETGGQNAMIVDSTALPEQVARDVLASAFDSEGQRCSALRVLFLMDDVADRMLDLILGAMDELKIGDPMRLDTDIGPVIDEDAREVLEKHSMHMAREAKLLRRLPLGAEHENGVFFAPRVFEIERLSQLTHEVFGPVLHVIRYRADRLDAVCDAVNATGYGLTLGLHSRIDETADFIAARVRVGNFYVNRNQIGAVVGVQPFGGEGLSGTGPKAGGPHYLSRFAVERTRTVNTTAAGGNAALLANSI
jgi:RHH-type proline utilization regulon transcriptional repressor/proline dehydrogenase/delta 1-pyrroline-5-carboxylate dehydrogenase